MGPEPVGIFLRVLARICESLGENHPMKAEARLRRMPRMWEWMHYRRLGCIAPDEERVVLSKVVAHFFFLINWCVKRSLV